MAKKAKKSAACPVSESCPCVGLMAILIIVLVWISPEMWSKIVITIAAVIILLGSGSCSSKMKKK